jgi:signal transduction histidine kinase
MLSPYRVGVLRRNSVGKSPAKTHDTKTELRSSKSAAAPLCSAQDHESSDADREQLPAARRARHLIADTAIRRGPFSWQPRLLDWSTERLICFSRLALASFGILAILLDPTQATRAAHATYAILIAYWLYSILLAAASLSGDLSPRKAFLSHAIDVLSLSALMHYTEGATSPYFILFTFVLLSATLRWNARRTLYTTAALVVCLTLVALIERLSISDSAPTEPKSLAIRVVYLIVTGAMLAYFGAFRDRSRDRLRGLASWPQEDLRRSEFPSLERTLSHAMLITGARGSLVVWEAEDEPFTYVAWKDNQRYNERQLAMQAFWSLVSPYLADASFVADESGLVACSTTPPTKVTKELISPVLAAEYSIDRFATATVMTARISGRVFIIDPESVTDDLLELVEIVAKRIQNEFEEHDLSLELARAVAVEERAHLARDVHDGVLQGLTAAGLRLRALARSHASETGREIEDVADIIADQQQALRSLVAERLGDNAWEARERCAELLQRLEREWQVTANLEVAPSGLELRSSVGQQLTLILTEAVANAVRHGFARSIQVKLFAEGHRLSLSIANDGTPTLSGSASLRARVVRLAGTLRLHDTESGVLIEIGLPL